MQQPLGWVIQSVALVEVSPMADRYDQDQEDVVVDLVDDAVVAGADPPLAVAAQRASSRHSGVAARRAARLLPGSGASPRGRACAVVGRRRVRPRRGSSCQAEVGLDLLPWDRGLPGSGRELQRGQPESRRAGSADSAGRQFRGRDSRPANRGRGVRSRAHGVRRGRDEDRSCSSAPYTPADPRVPPAVGGSTRVQ